MAVDIKAELERQLGTILEKIEALTTQLAELEPEKVRIETTIGFLTGKYTVEDVTKKRGKGGAAKGTMTEMHKAKIKLSNLKRRLAAEPKNADLKRKVGDIEALIASLEKK